ncbi:PREDICTED: turripeptide OL11-like [Ceratosolen solmsi marchali]|uniref:Turripeptide OL11-like n=1 Tax=Ceratosolen solmsi marchali TaxID=326594 RepID=A0AAJ6YK79_9HYME|nr:PREDICTED: turripeptide OL11-like [Ceratosolen solmsi marchali]
MLILCAIIVSIHAAPNKPPKPCKCITPGIYYPVCGSDNKTYGNKFMLKCENKCYSKKLKIVHDGKC